MTRYLRWQSAGHVASSQVSSCSALWQLLCFRQLEVNRLVQSKLLGTASHASEMLYIQSSTLMSTHLEATARMSQKSLLHAHKLEQRFGALNMLNHYRVELQSASTCICKVAAGVPTQLPLWRAADGRSSCKHMSMHDFSCDALSCFYQAFQDVAKMLQVLIKMHKEAWQARYLMMLTGVPRCKS